MNKILIGIPYHPNKRYALGHIMDWLENQTMRKDCDVFMTFDMGEYGAHNAIKEQMEKLRILSVVSGYDYLYIMEADTIPPLDCIEKLLSHRKDVVGALYYYRDAARSPVAWRKDDVHKGFMADPNPLVQVDGMGTGAVLLSVEALKSFSFYHWEIPDPDYPMYDKLIDKGFSVWLDKSLVCRHYADKESYF